MRHVHEPLTLPKHPQLLHEINQMSIAIKVWHIMDLSKEKAENANKLMAHNPNPEWKEVIELLRRCYNAIDEQRENPIKY